MKTVKLSSKWTLSVQDALGERDRGRVFEEWQRRKHYDVRRIYGFWCGYLEPKIWRCHFYDDSCRDPGDSEDVKPPPKIVERGVKRYCETLERASLPTRQRSLLGGSRRRRCSCG